MEKSKAEKSHWVKKKKTCCNAMLFPGNRDLLSKTLGGPVVPLACGFVRRDKSPGVARVVYEPLQAKISHLIFGGIHPL